MKYRHCLVLAAFTIGAATAWAADIKVIANSSVGATSVSADELKGVFLATKTSLSGSHVRNYRRSLVFTGKASMPKTLGTDAEVVAYVEKIKGAIGYVAAATSPGDAKVLDVK
jgi:hypothetical protein